MAAARMALCRSMATRIVARSRSQSRVEPSMSVNRKVTIPLAPPSGMVTFLFTDIEGSTRLWERDRATMRVAIERHNAILAAAIRAHGGYHFKTIGDAFQAAFANPVAAVAACVDAQRAL